MRKSIDYLDSEDFPLGSLTEGLVFDAMEILFTKVSNVSISLSDSLSTLELE
jgi:hypothetical protein